MLFLLGAATAYVTLPHALGWLKSVGGPNLQAIYDPIPYLGLILLMMTIFGLTFEFPVVLVSLELARVVTPARLLHSWRWAVIIIVVVAAVFTPELGPLLHVRARRPARRLLLPLHRHREAARALTAFPWPVQETAGAAEFEADLPFALDDFQHEAFGALDAGHSVLVSAPTGSGKTLVAAYAVHRALAAHGKAFYTTPLKALSNQKYGELVATYGEEHVGLLTGDTTLRPRAPVVVMTTEVLRNMLLAGSDLLEGLHTVVLDEVHFIQDPYRGGVWEEVLVLCPAEVRFVCLSATVNNANELGGWLRSVRGDTVGDRRAAPPDRPAAPLRRAPARGRRDDALPLLQDNGQPGGEGLRIDQAVRRALQVAAPATGRAGGGDRGCPTARRGAPRWSKSSSTARCCPPSSSSSAAPPATTPCARSSATASASPTPPSATPSARSPSAGSSRSTTTTCGVLGYDEWLEGLERGVAAHHAGLVPVFRETVEECFEAGLLKVVFATETLSLGINMPARSVVIERFTKYGGAGRATLTSGEYLQLTGRAGRRGLDEEGHAVVAWSSEITFAEAARVASAPPPDLRSAFRPTYNLAVNLVARFDRDTAARRPAALLRPVAGPHTRPPAAAAGPPGRRPGAAGLPRGLDVTPAGRGLSRIYHEADLLIAEALGADLLAGAEPAVLAGVLSSVVFEPRRARRVPGHQSPRREKPRRPLQDRLGDKRTVRAGLAQRGPGRPGRAHPCHRRAAPGAPHPPAGARPGHRGGLVGPGGVVRHRPRGGRPRRGRAGPRRLRPDDEVGGRPGPAGLPYRGGHRGGGGRPGGRRPPPAGGRGRGSPGPLSPSATVASPSFYGYPGMFPYSEERFTADEEAVLRRYVTNLDQPVFALVNLPEVVKGALFARYSRSPKSLRRLFLDEFVGDLDVSGDATVDATVGLERAEQLYEKVFVEYGDDSVAQLGGVHLACEQASNVLSKVLEWGRLMAYLEQSTRYIAYNQRLENGQYRYFRPPEILDSPHGARFVGEMDRVFDTYGALLPQMQAWVAERFPQQAGDSDFVYRQATRAKSLDALRGLLPAASLSNIGIYGTGQAYEQLLLRMRAHPLPEARHYADLMLDELRKVIPSFLQRVDVPARGGEWSEYLASTRDRTARLVSRLWPELGPLEAPTRGDEGEPRGGAPRLRSRRGGEGPGGGLFLAPRTAPSAKRPAGCATSVTTTASPC